MEKYPRIAMELDKAMAERMFKTMDEAFSKAVEERENVSVSEVRERYKI